MTIIFEEDNCKLIRHIPLLTHQEENGNIAQYQLKDLLFKNFKRKQKKIVKVDNELRARIESFLSSCKKKKLFSTTEDDMRDRLKDDNIKLMNDFYALPSDSGTFRGENNLSMGQLTNLNGTFYLIPPRCKFFNNRIETMKAILPPSDDSKFDFIVIDPPWRNRYIKRVKKTTLKQQGYNMMTDDEINEIPLGEYLKKSSIVVIWCTNSEAHIKAIKEKIIIKWNLKLASTWQWIKVDTDGELFCSLDGGKKPFEQIFIATHRDNEDELASLRNDLLIFSQPSSIHSHKPPLIGNEMCTSFKLD